METDRQGQIEQTRDLRRQTDLLTKDRQNRQEEGRTDKRLTRASSMLLNYLFLFLFLLCGSSQVGVLRNGVDEQNFLVSSLLAANGTRAVVADQFWNGAELGLRCDEALVLLIADLEVQNLTTLTVCGVCVCVCVCVHEICV